MLKPYNPLYHTTDPKKKIEIGNCFELTGYEFKDLIAVTGIFGLPQYKSFDAIPEKELSGNYPTPKMDIYSELLTLSCSIDLENKIIKNLYLKINQPGQGLGLKILVSMLEEAEKAGIKKITCKAIGNVENKFVGYIVWGKLGFTMVDENMYKNKVSKYNSRLQDKSQQIPNMPLDILLFSEHKAFWEKHGESWEAEFSLGRPSKNREILKHYIENKCMHFRSIINVYKERHPLPRISKAALINRGKIAVCQRKLNTLLEIDKSIF